MSVLHLLVADDHPLVLRGIGDFLKAQPGLNIVALCSDGAQAIDGIRTLKPDIAVLDLSMPVLSGLDVLARTNSEGMQTRIVFLSAALHSRDIVRAMSEGAYGLLQKDCEPDALLHCIRRVGNGQKCVPFELLQRTRQNELAGNGNNLLDLLTSQEWKVMALVIEGHPNKKIAQRLGVSEGTIKTHLNHIFKKTGAASRTALANLAFTQLEKR